MDIIEAKQILSLLADGINPITKDLLPADSICNQVEIVRAFHCVLNTLSRIGDKDYPPNAGMPWTKEEDESLLAAVREGKTVPELAKRHGRTTGAISSRLQKLAEDETIGADPLENK